jgi:hypothetical protein
MAKFIKILNVLIEEVPNCPTQEATLKKLLSQLFDKITSSPERKDHDFFHTYERMFALTAYVFLLKFSKEETTFSGVTDEVMGRCYHVLRF